MTRFAVLQLMLIASIVIVNGVSAAVIKDKLKPVLNVAVIGAGASGLGSAKYALAHGYNVLVFEQAQSLGGIWWYTDDVGKNKYGVKVHSPMYKGLRALSPHFVMEYSDYPYPIGPISYLPQADVLNYLKSYADHFNVTKRIKFNHLVIRVLPIENDKWEIIVKDLVNNKVKTYIFDVVFVANGHSFAPIIPNYPGMSEYKGKIMHSHDYRTAEKFQGETVLVIGHGASGRDIVYQQMMIGNKVVSSQRRKDNETDEERAIIQKKLPPQVQLQDAVKRFTPTGVEFVDGTQQSFSLVIFATGYNYSFPFLSVDTGISVDDNYVSPLYKQVFNIQHPTMVFIGIPFNTCTTRTYDLQIRFAMKFISGQKKLPSKYEMLADMNEQMQKHWNKGYAKNKSHFLGPEQVEYFNQLAKTADIKNIPKVITKMEFDSGKTQKLLPYSFRNYKYTIVDDETFIKEKLD